tara:strand:- start:3176 stop:4456 length:1281 start_codon:yes stop_codon:yes gene_type:complete
LFREFEVNNHNNEWHQFSGSALYQGMSDCRVVQNPNILKTLFSTHDEVRLHTPMIGWLMDPDENHGLREEPLAQFLMLLGVEIERSQLAGARVWCERAFPDLGRVDLLLQFSGGYLVIENKLHAADQEAQLWRYQEVLRHLSPDGDCYLFYLTLEGSEPSDVSVNDPEENGAKGNKANYQCISYRSDIHIWLKTLIEITAKAPDMGRTHQILSQYNEVVMEAVGMHSREEAYELLSRTGLRDHLESRPEDASVVMRLARSVTYLHASLLDELVSRISEQLGDDSRLELVAPPARWGKLDWSIYEAWASNKPSAGYVFFRIQGVESPELDGVHLVMGIDTADSLWIGLGRFSGSEHMKAPGGYDPFVGMKGVQSNEWWLGWYTLPGLNPVNFDGEDGVARLIEEKAMADAVKTAVQVAQKYLEEITC